jgi:hypothetical protein
MIYFAHGFRGFGSEFLGPMHMEKTTWQQDHVDDEAVYSLADGKQRE